MINNNNKNYLLIEYDELTGNKYMRVSTRNLSFIQNGSIVIKNELGLN